LDRYLGTLCNEPSNQKRVTPVLIERWAFVHWCTVMVQIVVCWIYSTDDNYGFVACMIDWYQLGIKAMYNLAEILLWVQSNARLVSALV